MNSAATARPNGVLVDQVDAPQYRPPGIARRIAALVASSGLGLLFGLMSAIVIAFALAFAVTWMTGLLQR